MLESAGHRVSALDMAASGIDSRTLADLNLVSEYSQPLIDFIGSLPSDEKVILVGHSFGGAVLSLAMERFPYKLSVAVFITAFMPGPDLALTSILHQYYARLDSQMDNKFSFANGMEHPPTSFGLGEEFLASIMYQLCPPEILTLAKMLVRPVCLLPDAIVTDDVVLSKEKYGLVPRIYVVCDQDKLIKKDLQEWILEHNPAQEVKEIVGADHMAMLSKPQELCVCLEAISATYS